MSAATDPRFGAVEGAGNTIGNWVTRYGLATVISVVFMVYLIYSNLVVVQRHEAILVQMQTTQLEITRQQSETNRQIGQIATTLERIERSR